MPDGFDLLEEKVRRAADLVRRLRQQNRTLQEDLGQARARLGEIEKRLESLQKERGGPSGRGREVEALKGELKRLRQEREEIRGRIARLVDVLDGLE